ncbi:response regulator transcription factor [Rhizobium ruizarguesonis]|jgi:two-component system nitrate/nitrite response regulator NarL|uniref:Response regulator transcription factor n=1 Tax=Rhizobium ruizarguesonis TaxID=2081791 RepID=A0AAE5C0D9_9HYPH|nr:two-component system response regulator MctR [Rhizobium ruizarguesonis]QJS31735.1 two-component system response regulator MctR [Rhizobium leguminosarum bv. trifolii TA1]MCB2399473.1 two-component system response regulator MctR [Rhizobium ruizarguesonis]NEH27728.1 two-component system response regulator MctR [Rhizobium ruizarguesonis]NEI21082.1 two-component system response regulator MctR [Rhizobium ruizarguesonis]NEI46166.1 two-component system response regulator MctR [Rhizobium ruizargueso
MTERPKIRVLLIDNHPLVLDGLKAVLETFDHIEVAGTAGLAQAGLEIGRQVLPQVVLMDINMPKLSGIDAIELFRNELPQARVVMLSMHDSREYISSSVMHGAAGYILKDVSTDEIVSAIETVAGGGTYFSSGVFDALMGERAEESSDPLTPRERDILGLIVAGRSNKEIAETLGITSATAETHRKNLKKKLGIATTAGLIRYALDHGIVSKVG